MKNYQSPEAEIIMFIPDENITDVVPGGEPGITSNSPWSMRPIDDHDAAHGE